MLARRTLLAGTGAGLALAGLATAHGHADEPPRRTYYVAADGSDEAAGTTPATPWATTTKINSTTLRPGDRVLFRRGDRWDGNLVITDSGAPGAPITIGSYGSGSRPRIDAHLPGDDVLAATVLVHNAEYVHVQDLELTNTAAEQGMRTGMLVAVDAPTQPVYSGYRIHNLYVHDVTGAIDHISNDTKRSGGIGVYLDGSAEAVSRLHDVVITDNTVERVDQTGIWIDGNLRSKNLPPGTDTVYRGYTWDQIKYTGVEIAYNHVTDTARNGVIIRYADSGSFHHNEVSWTTRRVEGGNSVFTVSVYRFVVEWNEVHHNRAYGTADGCAFDPDLDSPETVWRNNYSHDNAFGLMTLCTRPRDYGIQVNQNIDIGGSGRLLNLNYGFTDVTFERNAFWVKPVPDVQYPEEHPDYVNPDREIADGYPQVIWETYHRNSSSFITPQTYTYRNNAVFNEASTATFYLNPHDDTSHRTTDRTVVDNTLYGTVPDKINPIADGFHHAGEQAPSRWIADAVGARTYAFWAGAMEGRGRGPAIGPRPGIAG
ncbi:hypothetical protein [Microlunatus sp. Y2014]|uniref:hypothetical protein n=1 Tax=Microlunatus sp. Y2014 TaxID=3418488 RepID=UPI003DA75C94